MEWRSCLIVGGAIESDKSIASIRFHALPAPKHAIPALLVQVQGSAASGGEINAYHALACTRLWIDPEKPLGWADLTQRETTLESGEQALLRRWLVGESNEHWRAWARAHVSVRALAGEPEGLISLADAARRTGEVYITLVKAAESQRLPTVDALDRRLVYLTTIREANEFGLINRPVGRPKKEV